MPKKKQESATDLLKSFEVQCRRRLTAADREFCDRLVSQVADERQMSAAIMGYLKGGSRARGIDRTAVFEQFDHMQNYLSVFRGLLLSYSPQKGTTAFAPEKFYAPAPRSLEMSLVVIPNHNIIIKAGKLSGEAWYGSKRENAGVLLDIKVFRKEDEWRLMCSGSYVDTQYPRFSISCRESSRCRAYMESDLNFCVGNDTSSTVVTECRMSLNRSKGCPLEIGNTRAFGAGLSGFLAIVLMCYDRWQKRPVSTGTKKQESYSERGVAYIAKTPQWVHSSEGFREVQLREYPDFSSQMRARGWNVENRASPCEHERRGHMRSLKDGRTVYVRPSIVNKGGERVVYRVKENSEYNQ